MQNNRLTKIAVYAKSIDNIIGMVHLRDMLLNPDTPLDKFVRKVHFVPEQKTVESLLELFRKTKTDTAIVVDEYGGIDGSIQLEDIAEELIGPIQAGEKPEPIQSIGPLEYRLSGNLPIHDWAEVFDIETGIDLSAVGIHTCPVLDPGTELDPGTDLTVLRTAEIAGIISAQGFQDRIITTITPFRNMKIMYSDRLN